MLVKIIKGIVAILGVVIGLIPALFTYRAAKRTKQEQAIAAYKSTDEEKIASDVDFECILTPKTGSFLGFYVGLGDIECVPEYTAQPKPKLK